MRLEHPQIYTEVGLYLFFISNFLLALFVTVAIIPNSPSTRPVVVSQQ